MKKTALALAILMVFAGFLAAKSKQRVEANPGDILKYIHWLHHSSFKIEAMGRVIYIDPYQVKDTTPADYIFITHAHPDHFSIPDINKLKKKDTLIICPKKVAEKLKGYNVKEVKPGDILLMAGVKAEAVPAYNNWKIFHPKGDLNVGYVLTINGWRIYHAGDTDFIPEMKQLQNLTVAMVPIDGIFAMSAKEAAKAINTMKPLYAVPMHYGFNKLVKKDAAEKFKALVDNGITVEILKQEE